MNTSEFDYNLPEELIATHPVEPRDSARLLVLNKATGDISDRVFSDLADMLTENDVLVLNKSKVIPARLRAIVSSHSPVTSSVKGSDPLKAPRSFEVLLVKQAGELWECWVKNGRKLKAGEELIFSEVLSARYKKRENEIFYLDFNLKGAEFYTELTRIGEMPIPPYIVKARKASSFKPQASTTASKPEALDHEADAVDYQTVYAEDPGSVAAPTAGLHFTGELLEKLEKKGIQIEYVTLHVGLGTFQPLNTENIEDFRIHSEYIEIDPETAKRLNEAKTAEKRIIAVGTTSVRAIESACTRSPEARSPELEASLGETSIYIYPGYKYKFVDAVITNFHLPKSSLLLLVSAFAGKDNIDEAYRHAIEAKYRFYSYGDAMLIE